MNDNPIPDRPDPAPGSAEVPGAAWSTPPESRRERRGYDFYPPAEQLAAIPTVERARAAAIPVDDQVVHLHYFGAVGDWWLTALDRGPDPQDWIGYGYTCLAGLEEFAEWGDVWLPELEALHSPRRPLLIVERDLHWTPCPFGQIGDVR